MKHSLEDLAILGGPTSFIEKLHVGRPNIGDREKLLARFNDMLDRRWLSNDGPFNKELEERLSDYTGAKHCIAMCSATVALEIAIRALDLKGEVIVPSFTFIATAHALQWQEITPVFCDINPLTHNIDPDRVEDLITPHTTGIIGVHVWGRACEIERLEEIAHRRTLKILFDAAHAFGCTHRGRMIGNFGHAEVFSFHATKFFNTFEGGAVVTNDDDLAAKIRLMKNFGFAGYDEVIYIGTNGKMSEASAAMGLTNLESVDDFIAKNFDNYKMYQKGLSGLQGIKLLEFRENESYNYQYIVLEVDGYNGALTRDELQQVLWAENIAARRYFYPGCHRMEPYRSFFPHAKLLLPETEKLSQQVLLLPTGTAVDASQIDTICQIIRLAANNAYEVRERLRMDIPQFVQ